MDPRPLVLRADNFTPVARTPWGGTRILSDYKAALGLTAGSGIVGESWEVSVEPSFPSETRDGRKLADVIAVAPRAWLGPEIAARYNGQTPLLVKLLDAADNLSVQVHPADGDPELSAGESGKPESWVILAAEPGAGLYLGFRDGVGAAEVRACLAEGGELNELMSFVPVAPGDVFVIAAGTAHAIGKGVTLVEPQFVAPGRRGVTYRFWDWNRRYGGKPRALHVERSLAVTSWDAPRGDAFVATCRGGRAQGDLSGSLQCTAVVDWPWFVVQDWRGSGTLPIPSSGTMWAVVCVAGELTLGCESGELVIRRGESAVIPASAGAFELRGDQAHAIATRSA